MAPETKKQPVNAKDLITYVTAILMIAGSYFALKYETQACKEKVDKIEKVIEDNNLVLINYKLDELQKSQDDFINKFNQLLNNYELVPKTDSRGR